MSGFLKRVVVRGLGFLPVRFTESFVLRLVSLRVASLSPDQALRFLFGLDATLCTLEVKKAIEYEGGMHTKHRHTRYHDFIVSRIRPDEWVLDIGCRIGAVAYDVAERADAPVVGIDLDPDKIVEARQRYAHPRVECRYGDALEELPDRSFDVVILSNFLEHFSERPAFLRRVQKAVHPSCFIVRVPLLERDWRVPLKRELSVEWRLDPSHETEYTLESFSQETVAAGLRISHLEIRWGEIWAELLPNASTRS